MSGCPGCPHAARLTDLELRGDGWDKQIGLLLDAVERLDDRPRWWRRLLTAWRKH